MYSPNDQADRNGVEVLGLAPRFRQASKALALLVSTLGLVVFCGWVFNVPSLTYIRPTLESMKVNTTLSFLCLGAGLWLANNNERQGIRRILGLLVIIIAGSTLAEYAFHISLRIDQLLVRDTRILSISDYPGRMAISTAICFLFLGFAVMLLGLKKALALQRSLVAACFALSLVALCGYLYGVKSLYSITPYSTMAVHTTAGLMAACLAYFLARPNEGIVSIAASDSNSGFLVRTLVPAIVVVPILIGWLSLVGHRTDLYDTPFGAPLLVLASIGCLAVLTILVARSMYRWECESFHAERTIRESEQRFRLVADTAPVMIWMSGADKLCNYFNQRWLEFTGRPLEAELGNGWAEGVHPEDLNRCMHTYTQAFDRRESFQMEYRLRRHDGEYRWLSDIGVSRLNPDGSFAGYIGSCIDVTDAKLAQEVLADVGRRLIEGHEQERTWIARELHDDINQRMALLAIELDRWNQQLPPSAVEFHDHMHHASQRLSDIANDIQALSHRLHSSKLEYLGLVAAAKSFCKDLSEQQNVEIDFSHTAIPRSVPHEISLCLFRVLQETLQNAVKHSGVRHFKVELCGTEGEIQLTVSDLGVGFDPQDAIHRRGLGLISMGERMQLVSGEFSIKSHPGSGTTIHARVPFDSSSDSARAAG